MNNNNLTRSMVLLTALTFGGCGGGGGGDDGGGGGGPGATGTVAVLLSDAPIGQWDQAIATVTSVQLLGDGAPVTIFSGSQTLDLLKLSDFSELFAVSGDVPVGEYDKIRLQVSDLVLNDIDPATGAVMDNEDVQLVGNGKIDLNPRGPFTVGEDEVIIVELDFDMAKSLKLTDTGSGNFIMRPVVFVDISTERATARLSRVHGTIRSIDADVGEFELCQTEFASGDANGTFGDEHCMIVGVDDDTALFDRDAEPIELDDLTEDDEVTVIGRLHALEDEDLALLFEAYVVEEGPLGSFRRVAGSVASTVDGADRFGLNVAPGQGIATDTPLPVQLFDTSRVFDNFGEELETADIGPGMDAVADGVLVLGADDHLASPLVVLSEAGTTLETINGTLISVDTGAQSLIVNDGTADLCVDATSADVFLVSDSDGFATTPGDLGDLTAGQDVAVFGSDEGGCLAAEAIFADQ